jgi:HSP20 family molecular chaperone IbpA
VSALLALRIFANVRREGEAAHELAVGALHAVGVKAMFTDGLLELALPKKEEAKPKKIHLEIRKKIAAAA